MRTWIDSVDAVYYQAQIVQAGSSFRLLYTLPSSCFFSFSFLFFFSVGTMMIYDYEETLIWIEKGRVDIGRIGATSRYSLVTIV